jgi:cytochrome c-type biogenesis protein CcmH/NrfF
MLPDWLLWLLPVPLATVGALLWTAWTSRARGPQDAVDGVAEYERFRRALSTATRRREDETP